MYKSSDWMYNKLWRGMLACYLYINLPCASVSFTGCFESLRIQTKTMNNYICIGMVVSICGLCVCCCQEVPPTRSRPDGLPDSDAKKPVMNTRIITGWHMIDDSENSLPPNQAASGLTQIKHCGALSLQAKASHCKYCFSLFHQSVHCEFIPSSDPSSHDQKTCRWWYICRQYNGQNTQGCTYPNCHYKHACYNCAFKSAAKDFHHKALFCHNCPAQQSTTCQQPRPLFLWWLLQNFQHTMFDSAVILCVLILYSLGRYFNDVDNCKTLTTLGFVLL